LAVNMHLWKPGSNSGRQMGESQFSKAEMQVLVPAGELNAEMAFFEALDFRLEQIFPADDPAVAVMSGHGIEIRLDVGYEGPAPTLCLRTNSPEAWGGPRDLNAPSGTTITYVAPHATPAQPPAHHPLEIRRLTDAAPWIIGRAGMHYRDLIPSRLGGSIIASHIRIPEGGPVPDRVHYHTVGFQLIHCLRGWVDLVYEDQGPPFRLHAGECVTQPPEIRHQVLRASDGLEVIEIGVPAVHMTTLDHDMTLPTAVMRPERTWAGQRFLRHQLADAEWRPGYAEGAEICATGVEGATSGLAKVWKVKLAGEGGMRTHTADIEFTYLISGGLQIEIEGEAHALQAGDAFVAPRETPYRVHCPSESAELLLFSLYPAERSPAQ
ncbi:MAG: cupin domain-containing protein, partial [Bacteroidota bacterium]